MAKMEDLCISLASIAELSQGIIPYKTRAEGLNNPYISREPKGPDWKPLLDEGARVDRYSLSWKGLYVKYGDWLWCERDAKFFENPRLLFHRIRKRLPIQLVATFDDQSYYNRHALSNIIARDDQYSLKYILGLFNSKLLNFWFVSKFGLLMEAAIFKVSQLPIRHIDFDNPNDVKMHDDLVALVERMLDLHKRLKEAVGEEKKHLEHQIARTDRKIDNLVYELYGITEEERKIIDEKTSPFRATLRNTGRKWHLSRSTLSIRPIDGVVPFASPISIMPNHSPTTSLLLPTTAILSSSILNRLSSPCAASLITPRP